MDQSFFAHSVLGNEELVLIACHSLLHLTQHQRLSSFYLHLTSWQEHFFHTLFCLLSPSSASAIHLQMLLRGANNQVLEPRQVDVGMTS